MKEETSVGSPLIKKGRVFFIAEAGVNHNGTLSRAIKLVDVAARAGADAVKFQTFQTELLASQGARKAEYQAKNTGRRGNQRDMLRKLELSERTHCEIIKRCRQRGILFLSTPFDCFSVDLLERLKVTAYKISSGDLTNFPFLKYVAKKRKPIILSTGMATLEEVQKAVQTLRRSGNKKLVLLHCVSAYPADPADMNLRAMDTLRRVFGVPVGLSDHTPGGMTAVAATALGADVIEKHFTLKRTLVGPDHSFSLTPAQLQKTIRDVRLTEAAMGDGVKHPVFAERPIASVSRKSIFSACLLKKGDRLTMSSVAILRPGTGLPPTALRSLLGRKARRSIGVGRMLKREMFQ